MSKAWAEPATRGAEQPPRRATAIARFIAAMACGYSERM